MKEVLVKGKNLPEAYHKALIELNTNGEISDCTDWDTTQKELSMTIFVEQPMSEPRISKLFIGGPEELEQYRQEMLYGILDFEVQQGNWAYTYHQRYAEQIPFVIKDLKRSRGSRRAVMVVRDWKIDSLSEDPACLQHVQYFIRKGKLDCVVLFRSNDACKATFMNAFALICLQDMIAQELGVEPGTYTHRANSFHCYEKDFPLLDGYCKRLATGDFDDVTYDYKDGWDEMMEAAKPMIAARVEELKSR
jgi:thymidylate synthase